MQAATAQMVEVEALEEGYQDKLSKSGDPLPSLKALRSRVCGEGSPRVSVRVGDMTEDA